MELFEIVLSKEEMEKAEQIIRILDGMTIYSARNLLEKCETILTATRVSSKNFSINRK